ncbi:hypothetical protein K438DRAFT_1780290 [Mycena galopus ATCC 62051]|nr:hypothetical protein K438DRAFT_1780290 [Mycena galopus ATCC 62051]
MSVDLLKWSSGIIKDGRHISLMAHLANRVNLFHSRGIYVPAEREMDRIEINIQRRDPTNMSVSDSYQGGRISEEFVREEGKTTRLDGQAVPFEQKTASFGRDADEVDNNFWAGFKDIHPCDRENPSQGICESANGEVPERASATERDNT